MKARVVGGWVLMAAFAVGAAAGGEPGEPLARRMRLRVWGGNLAVAAEQFREQAGLTVTAWRSVRAEAGGGPVYAERPLYVSTGPVATGTALEMLARAAGCRYRIGGDGDTAWLVDGYEWVNEPLQSRTAVVNSLLGAGDDAAALERRLREMARAAALGDGSRRGWRFAVQTYAAGSGETGYRLETRLPRTLDDYVRRMLLALSGPGEALTPRPGPPPTVDAGPAADPPVTARFRDQPAEAALAELSLQTGWVFGFDNGPFMERPPPTVGLDLARRPGREAAREISKALGLGGGAERWVDGVVWLSPSARRWERGRMARRVLWEDLETRVFAAGALAEARGGWEPLLRELRETAEPWIWDDPMTALVPHPRSGALAARAPAETLAVVRAALDRMATGADGGK